MNDDIKKVKFMDSYFLVPDDVFTPRPETELLVNVTLYALEILGDSPKPAGILDIGTGSGNVAISLTKLNKNCKLICLDIDKKALDIAKTNAELNGVSDKIQFVHSDLFDGLHERYGLSFDIIVSNPPYVAKWEIATLSEPAKAEPLIAIDGGEDGLDFYRRLCSGAWRFLTKGGFLIMEMGYNQAHFIKDLLTQNNFTDFELFKDNAGIERIIMARHG